MEDVLVGGRRKGFVVNRMFSNLMSRWTTPTSCNHPTALTSSLNTLLTKPSPSLSQPISLFSEPPPAATDPGSGAGKIIRRLFSSSLISSNNSPPPAASNTKTSCLSVENSSMYPTIDGCEMCLKTEASRRKAIRVRGSGNGCVKSLSATTRLVDVGASVGAAAEGEGGVVTAVAGTADQTAEKAPCPIFLTNLHPPPLIPPFPFPFPLSCSPTSAALALERQGSITSPAFTLSSTPA